MTIIDPIADMLTRMRNALAVGKGSIAMPFSKEKLAIATVLKQQGYILDAAQVQPKESKFPQLAITLKYNGNRSVIRGIKRISKPGQRIYEPASHIKPVLSGIGTAVVSTSKGLLTDKEAREQGIGGEVLFKIW